MFFARYFAMFFPMQLSFMDDLPHGSHGCGPARGFFSADSPLTFHRCSDLRRVEKKRQTGR